MHRREFLRAAGPAAAGAFCASFWPHLLPAEQPVLNIAIEPRHHDAGPITANNFKTTAPEPPVNKGIQAEFYLAIRLMADFGFRESRRDGKPTFSLRDVKVYAVMLPHRSWISDEQDQRLLQSAQGHFDVAAVGAAELTVELTREVMAGSALVGSGTTSAAGVRDLEQKVLSRVKTQEECVKQRQMAFDTSTQHGTNAEALIKALNSNRRQLASLQRTLNELRSPTMNADIPE